MKGFTTYLGQLNFFKQYSNLPLIQCSLVCHTLKAAKKKPGKQLWLVGCAGCTVFGCLWQTSLCRNFGSNFLAGQGI